MKWIEIITLRSVDNIHKSLILELLHQIEQNDAADGLTAISFYHQVEVSNNLSIHIHWKSEKESQCKSPLGLRLSSALKPLGLLHHSVWVETSGREFVARSWVNSKPLTSTYNQQGIEK